jgi:hypothetical protein
VESDLLIWIKKAASQQLRVEVKPGFSQPLPLATSRAFVVGLKKERLFWLL